MEQTPFDPFHDLPPGEPPSANSPAPPFDPFGTPTQPVPPMQPPPPLQPAPQLQPGNTWSAPNTPPPNAATSVPFNTLPPGALPPQIGANLPPSRTLKKTNPALYLVPLAALLLVGGGFGFAAYQKKQEAQAREEKLASLRADIKKVVLQDNALVMEMLDDGALEHITYAEFFKRADKNKESRDELIRQLRSTETGPYGEAVGHYVQLLGTENDWVRSEEAVSRSSLDASSKWDVYDRANKQSSDAGGSVQSSYAAYLAAPYGSDFSEKMDYDLAKARLTGATETARSAFADWTGAQDDLKDKKRAASVVIADWLRNEPLAYPDFAPKRDVERLLVARKAEYVGALGGSPSTSGKGETQVKTSTGAVAMNTSSSVSSVQPDRAPAPSSPFRVHATKPLDGERFATTRMDDLTSDYATNLSDDDLRYAINEMYARYGLTFKDKSLQSQFEQTTWYRPNEAWTMPQIERAFSPRERANLQLLVSERADRRRGRDTSSAGANSDDSTSDSPTNDSTTSDSTTSDSTTSDSTTSDSPGNGDSGSSHTGQRNVEADG